MKDDWINRLEVELQELVIKIQKLEKYLEDHDDALLYVQNCAMQSYASILQLRLETIYKKEEK